MSKRNPICAGGFLKNLTRCCLAAVPGTQQPQHTAPVIYGIEVREHQLLCLTQSAKSALKLEPASVRLASAVTTALQHEGIAEPTVDCRSFCCGQQSWTCIDTAACNTSSILQAFGLILGFKLSERSAIFSVSRQQSGVSCGLTQHHYFHRICWQREIHCCRYRRTSKNKPQVATFRLSRQNRTYGLVSRPLLLGVPIGSKDAEGTALVRVPSELYLSDVAREQRVYFCICQKAADSLSDNAHFTRTASGVPHGLLLQKQFRMFTQHPGRCRPSIR